MGLFDWMTKAGGTASVNDSIHLDVMGMVQKDWDYAASTIEAQSGQVVFSGQPFSPLWSNDRDYAFKSKLLLETCPISKACVDMRATGVAAVGLDVEGTRVSGIRQMMVSPNSVDRTIATALRSWETQLCVGGDLYLVWDWRTPGRPEVTNLRPDVVGNNVKLRRYEYTPGRISGTSDTPEFIFNYDASGATTSALRLVGRSYQPINLALQRIARYNPVSPLVGLSPADSAIRSVELWLMIDDLEQRKFKSGGSKAGYFKAPAGGGYTDAQLAAFAAQVRTLDPSGELNLLPGGADFLSAQLTFQELQLTELKDKAADAICTAFGINSTMVNVGQATHANLRGMDKILYRGLIGPEAKWLIGQLEWGARKYIDATAKITVDETDLPHVQDDLRDNAVAFAALGVLTVNEVRAGLGYPPLSKEQGGEELSYSKPPSGGGTGLGQPEEKPGGDTSFNANAGDLGDKNDQ